MVVVMVLAFLVTWLPYASMALAVIIDSSLHIHPIVATIPVYLAKSSNVYNPVIYIFMNRQVSVHILDTVKHAVYGGCTDHVGLFVCFQFRGHAVKTVCCGWNPWALGDPQMSEVDTTVASLNKSQKLSPKGSLK